MSTDRTARAWMEVSPASLRRNLRRVMDAVPPGVRVMPMVKARGYGLGMREVVSALAPLEPWGWGVATVEEGAELRAAGIEGPILVFSPLPPGAETEAVRNRLSVAVSEVATLDRLREVADDDPVGIHVELDTGIGRAGFDARRVGEWAPAIRSRLVAPLRWEGLFTHFHSADEHGGPGVEAQLEAFRRVASRLNPPGAVLLHVANSAAVFRLRHRLRGFGMVRPGIFLFGGGCGPDLPEPEPVVTLRARVVRVAEVDAGTPLGYGSTYHAEGPERWATLGVGYGDGYPRSVSNRGQVLLQGKRVPVVGRVSMDMTVVNITGLAGVVPGDVATLLGSDGDDTIGLDELAVWAGTISYEVLTGFTGRLPRIWVEDGNE